MRQLGLQARAAAASCALLGLLPAADVRAAEPDGTVSQSALRACAAMGVDAQRLACYDQLAGRAAKSGGSTASAAAHNASSASSTPQVAAPATGAAAASTGTAVAVKAPSSGAASATPAASVGTTPAAAAKAVAAPPADPQTFGLAAVEHPVAPAQAPSLQARVLGVGTSPSGHMTMTLQGGAVWELEGTDPLLAAGDTITIRRAALGSFLLETPSKRTHRVRRLH
jgi:hypothetical protein